MRGFILMILAIIPLISYAQKKIPYHILQSFNYSERAGNELNDGNYEAAIELASQAIGFEKTNYDAWLIRGEAELYSNKPDDARRDLLEVITLKPTLSRAYADLGDLDINDASKAIEDFTMAIKYGKLAGKINLSTYYSSRADRKCDLLDWDGALSDCNSALLVNSENFSAHTIRAQVELKEDNYLAALNDANKAISLLPGKDAWMYYYRGVAELKLNRSDAACEDFEQSKKIGGCPDAFQAAMKYCR